MKDILNLTKLITKNPTRQYAKCIHIDDTHKTQFNNPYIAIYSDGYYLVKFESKSCFEFNLKTDRELNNVDKNMTSIKCNFPNWEAVIPIGDYRYYSEDEVEQFIDIGKNCKKSYLRYYEAIGFVATPMRKMALETEMTFLNENLTKFLKCIKGETIIQKTLSSNENFLKFKVETITGYYTLCLLGVSLNDK